MSSRAKSWNMTGIRTELGRAKKSWEPADRYTKVEEKPKKAAAKKPVKDVKVEVAKVEAVKVETVEEDVKVEEKTEAAIVEKVSEK